MSKKQISLKSFNNLVMLYRISMFILTLTVIILYSIIRNKYVEFALMFTTYFLTKSLYSSQFHSKSLKACTCISISVFITLTELSYKFEFSILTCAVIGLLSAYISCEFSKVKEKADKYDRIIPDYNDYISRRDSFNINDCTYDDLIERCKFHNFSSEQTDFCISAFYYKMSIVDLADKYCIELQSAKNKKSALKHKLLK